MDHVTWASPSAWCATLGSVSSYKTMLLRQNMEQKILLFFHKWPLQQQQQHLVSPSLQLPADTHRERQKMVAQLVGSLPPMRETWGEFPSACIEPGHLQAFGN